jgi:hypothetical protein
MAGLAVAMAVHSALDPVLLESTRQTCLEYELPKHGISARRHAPIPIDNRDRVSCWLADAKV